MPFIKIFRTNKPNDASIVEYELNQPLRRIIRKNQQYLNENNTRVRMGVDVINDWDLLMSECLF